MPAPRLIGGCQPKSSWMFVRHEAHMSSPPNPPGRLLTKNIQWPSREKVGARSPNEVLTGGPRLTGTPHGSSGRLRCETQMSLGPRLPGRSELKYRLNPFLETAGAKSFDGELTMGPRLTGTDQSEKFAAGSE